MCLWRLGHLCRHGLQLQGLNLVLMFRLQLSHRLGHRLSTGGGHVQCDQFAVQAHSIGAGTEGRSLPSRILFVAYGLDPLGKTLHGLSGQGLHRIGHRFLLGQPSIEHLFHRPSSFTELVQPHHA